MTNLAEIIIYLDKCEWNQIFFLTSHINPSILSALRDVLFNLKHYHLSNMCFPIIIIFGDSTRLPIHVLYENGADYVSANFSSLNKIKVLTFESVLHTLFWIFLFLFLHLWVYKLTSLQIALIMVTAQFIFFMLLKCILSSNIKNSNIGWSFEEFISCNFCCLEIFRLGRQQFSRR